MNRRATEEVETLGNPTVRFHYDQTYFVLFWDNVPSKGYQGLISATGTVLAASAKEHWWETHKQTVRK